MPQGLEWQGGYLASAVATATWNPSDKSASITLSGGNLTATNPSTPDTSVLVRATISASSGKKYWEVTATTNTLFSAFGISVAGVSVDSALGATAGGLAYFKDGSIECNSASLGTIQTYASGNVVCFALDLDNSKIWMRTGAGNWNNDVIGNQNPATNTGGISISGMTAGAKFATLDNFKQNDISTTNFGGSAYNQTPPAGFSNW